MPRPPQPIVHAGYTVLRGNGDGWIDGGSDGLYDYDTRILSAYRLLVDGQRPVLVAQAQPEAERFEAVYRVPRPGLTTTGPVLPADAIQLEVVRVVAGGMRDQWTVRNDSRVDWAGTLRIEIDADFADIGEVGGQRRQHGRLRRTARGAGVDIAYEAERQGRVFERAVRIRVVVATGEAPRAGRRDIRLPLRLAAGASTDFVVRFDSWVDGHWRTPSRAAVESLTAERAAWRRRRTRLEGPPRARVPFEVAVEDLYALRNTDLERELLTPPDVVSGNGYATDHANGHGSTPRAWLLNAGVPTFTGLFGRDVLTSGWQAALAGVEALRGAVEAIAATQASADDPWRDAEPGKMLHELRRGPLSELAITPRDAYYGTQTTPAMFVVALTELWHWTGEESLLRRYRRPALAAIGWAERSTDERGFLPYQRRSPEGLTNQGWKDSDGSIRHADGRVAETPHATVEEQAFAYLALQRMAEILVVLDEPGRADELLRRAERLRRRWQAAFWMPDEGFYAVAIDGRGEAVRSITSNPGHALAAGMVPAPFARVVADRLFSRGLFSGWGVRTLDEDHPSFDPEAYHLGSVWPVENATFALGLKRYGLDDHLDRLAGAVFEAAYRSPGHRLPEAISGRRRCPDSPPEPQPSANSPQAWSSSAVIQLVQVMLGIYPFAPLHMVALVRPRLPAWLPALTIRNLRVGGGTMDVLFERRGDGSATHTVLARRGEPIVLVPAAPPNDVTAGAKPWTELFARAAIDRAPGRLARAARIAMGVEPAPSSGGGLSALSFRLRPLGRREVSRRGPGSSPRPSRRTPRDRQALGGGSPSDTPPVAPRDPAEYSQTRR